MGFLGHGLERMPRGSGAVAGVMLALAAGCGVQSDAPVGDKGSDGSRGVGMPDTCRQVYGLLLEHDTGVLTEATADHLREELRSLAAAGDSEVRDAMPLLIRPTEAFVDGVDTTGKADEGVETTLDAAQAFTDGVIAFNDRCVEAGSRIL